MCGWSHRCTIPLVLGSDPIRLQARLEVAGDHLRGELLLPDGTPMAFDGWLGLIGAVEAACGSELLDREGESNLRDMFRGAP